MYHGVAPEVLYSAHKITVEFQDTATKDTRNKSGTCFFVRSNNGSVWLVTNRHIMDIDYDSNGKYKYYELYKVTVEGKANTQGQIRGSEKVKFETQNIKRCYSNELLNDICCFRVDNFDVGFYPESVFEVTYIINENIIATDEDFDNRINPCDFVVFPGFPEWHDVKNCRPIMRSGTISSDPKYNYSHGNVGGDCIAYEAFSSGGSSGSPVFAVQKGIRPGAGISFPGFREMKFIGINAGHLLAENDMYKPHSGISYLYKSSAIMDIIHNNE